MKSLVRIIVAIALLIGARAAFAQQSPKPTLLTVKDTPASQSLVDLSKKYVADNQAFQTARQQAVATLDQTVKSLQDELMKQQKSLHDQEENDKKFKPLLDKIDELQKQIQEAGVDANKKFTAEVGTVQQNIGTELAQINALIGVVKRENNFPDDAIYATDSQKWTETPSTAPTPPAPKK